MIRLDGNSLTLETLKSIVFERHPVEIHPETRISLNQIRQSIEAKASSPQPYYGINTGFGALAEKKISSENLETLQHNLILSHAVGVGEAFSQEEARTLMLLRLNTLSKGYSGCRSIILDYLVKLLNSNCYPYIPRKGSVGASGDLAPLAHSALLLLGIGPAFCEGKANSAQETLNYCQLEPLRLKAKEGLALINGTQAMTAVGALALLQARSLYDWANWIGACSLDGILGSDSPMDPRIQEIRPHPGQKHSAHQIRTLLEGSALRASHRNCSKVQDAYSFRCMPQVHGATRDTLDFVQQVLERELNSATDNPLVLNSEETLSGGNFHGQPVALALDYLGIAMAELGSISERRIEHMLNPHLSSGLPAFLSPDPGLNSGFMILQVTATALVAENKILAHPASVDSIPTSANREDHVSMGMNSANKAKNIIENVLNILAIELMVACQALDLRKPILSSPKIQNIQSGFRKSVAFAEKDRFFGEDLQKSICWLQSQIRDSTNWT